MKLGFKAIARGFTWVPTLYLAEGLPYAVVMIVAGTMFKRMGLSNTELAFYSSLLSLPWVIKPFWSPFVDMFSTKRLWIVATQLLIAAGFAVIAFSLPGTGWFRATVASFMIVGFLSATHDISADGFYMLALKDEGQSFFVGVRTMVYRLAMLIGQGPLVVLAGVLEERTGNVAYSWQMTFYILAGAMAVIAVYHAVVLPFPATDRASVVKTAKDVVREFIDTFREFFSKPHVVTAMLFMLLYKLPEAMLNRMIAPFLLDGHDFGGLALSTKDVGIVYGTVGLVGLILGGLVGGFVAAHGGLKRWLMPMAWGMSLTCLSFVVLAILEDPSMPTIYGGVFVEQFGYGFGTTAYILYLIHYSKGVRATSLYAIATGVMSLGMILPGMVAGVLQEMMGYLAFFVLTSLLCVVTIGVSKSVRRQL